jgi:hypothetical protein
MVILGTVPALVTFKIAAASAKSAISYAVVRLSEAALTEVGAQLAASAGGGGGGLEWGAPRMAGVIPDAMAKEGGWTRAER